jgi:hypothetical protein
MVGMRACTDKGGGAALRYAAEARGGTGSSVNLRACWSAAAAWAARSTTLTDERLRAASYAKST